MRIKLTVAYDGTQYAGFQSQNNAPAIQDVLNRAISDLFGSEIKTIGASRTDAGVHAMGNVAVFDIETRMDPSKICFALNTRLPADIRILESERVPDDFHPRYCDTVKTYKYRILNSRFADPIHRLYCTHCHYKLDSELMKKAAEDLVGEHDFASFCAAGFSGNSTVRTIYSCDVHRDGDIIVITITGNGFLYNMVRIIAGTLIDIGCGRRPADDIKKIIEARDRRRAGDTAPAKGLTLEEIRYI